MAKVTIDAINRTQKETKYGLKDQVGIKIVEATTTDVSGNTVNINDRWLNTFQAQGTEKWSKGDVVSIDLIEKDGKYLNFKPSSADSMAVTDLELRVKRLEEKVFGDVASKVATPEVEEVSSTYDDF